MEIIFNPNRNLWKKLVIRPVIESKNINSIVKPILKKIKKFGDEGIKVVMKEIDGFTINEFKVSHLEFKEARNKINNQLKSSIIEAKKNIEKFHLSQKIKKNIIETTSGVFCWRIEKPIEKVGLYIPGGSANLFSTLLMLGIPAQLAKCKNIIICSPPNNHGVINENILFVAELLNLNQVFKVGGSQAIAAMAYGTETIPKVYKIFGPGNQFVTKAKELIQKEGVAIDMPAGPSEILIIADKSAIASFVAADLLAQAEHGKDTQVILLTTYKKLIKDVCNEIIKQKKNLLRKDIIENALKNSKIILLNSLEECLEFSNMYAPEHLILVIDNVDIYQEKIENAGSVFIGNYSCESAGDYASGTNHTLPTNGYAKCYSGVSLDSFVKKITFQRITKQGIKKLGKTIEIMAESEGLYAHKNSVSIRLKSLV